MKLAINHYYLISNELKTNKASYQKLLISSIKQIKSYKMKSMVKNTGRIKYLLNLSLKHERMLSKVEINSASDLYAVSAEVAFARSKKYYANNITLNVYWSLPGALKRKYVSTFNELARKNALIRLNKILANMGLKEINIERYVK